MPSLPHPYSILYIDSYFHAKFHHAPITMINKLYTNLIQSEFLMLIPGHHTFNEINLFLTFLEYYGISGVFM